LVGATQFCLENAGKTETLKQKCGNFEKKSVELVELSKSPIALPRALGPTVFIILNLAGWLLHSCLAL
jgi:hypothetical protein